MTLTDVEYVSLADAFLEATPNGFVDSPTPDLSSYIWLDSEDGDLMIDLRKGDQPDYLISATGEPWNVSALNASDTPLNVHGVLVDPGHGLLHDARQVDFSAEIAAAERFDIRGSGSDEIMDATGSHRVSVVWSPGSDLIFGPEGEDNSLAGWHFDDWVEDFDPDRGSTEGLSYTFLDSTLTVMSAYGKTVLTNAKKAEDSRYDDIFVGDDSGSQFRLKNGGVDLITTGDGEDWIRVDDKFIDRSGQVRVTDLSSADVISLGGHEF